MTTEVVVAQRMWQRRGTTAEWLAANPVMAQGEIGFEYSNTDSTKLIGMKVGDDVTAWTALKYFFSAIRPVVALVDAATIAVDASKADNFRVVLGGNRVLGNPTGLSDGQTFNIRVIQDGTGGRTLSYGSMFKFPGGIVPTLSIAANARDFLSCQYDATNGSIYAVLNKAFA